MLITITTIIAMPTEWLIIYRLTVLESCNWIPLYSNRFRNVFQSHRISVGLRGTYPKFRYNVGFDMNPSSSESENLMDHARISRVKWYLIILRCSMPHIVSVSRKALILNIGEEPGSRASANCNWCKILRIL